MIPEVYKSFINSVVEKTNDGEVTWSAAADKSFVLRTSTATVEVGYYVDVDAEAGYYYFKFYNIANRKESGFRVSNLEGEFVVMEKLYNVASASAANIKDELSSFLDDLA